MKTREPWLQRQVRYLFHPLTKALRHARTDAYVVSYPKSGRTWLRVLLAQLYGLRAGVEAPSLEILEQGRAWNLPNIRFTHDDSSWETRWRTAEQLETNKSRYRNKKVVFVARDVRDVIVSSFFQATKRRNDFKGDISAFVRHEVFGPQKIIRFLNIWASQREVPRDFLLVRYEDMQRDTLDKARQLLDFLGIQASADPIERAIAASSFEKMQKLERGDAFQHRAMQPADAQDPDTYKVRRGKVGGYRDVLSPEDIAYIDQLVASSLDPFFGYTTPSNARA